MTRLTLTITNSDTASRIEALSQELGVSYPDIVTLAIRGKLPTKTKPEAFTPPFKCLDCERPLREHYLDESEDGDYMWHPIGGPYSPRHRIVDAVGNQT